MSVRREYYFNSASSLTLQGQSKLGIYLITGWFSKGAMMVLLQKIIGFFGFRCQSPIVKGSPPLLREGK